MSKVKELAEQIEELEKCGETIIGVARFLREVFGGNATSVETQKPKKEEPKITLEVVRSVLAEKSRAGFTAEVRTLIEKYGANKLSEISPEHFADVLTDAEVIGNAK